MSLNLKTTILGIVLILGVESIPIPFSFILSSAEARIVREPKEIHPPPGVNAEALLRNLYAIEVALDITSDEFADVFPSLNCISYKNFAEHRLNEEEFGQIIKEISETIEKELSPSYDTYSLRYDSPSGDFSNFLSIFEQEFVHILNTSGQMQKVFRMIECLYMGEYIAGQTRHGLSSEERQDEAFYWHKWILTVTGKVSSERGHRKLLLEGFNLGNFSLEDKELTLAYAYVLLTIGNVENLPRLLRRLSEDPDTARSIENIKKIIQGLNISLKLKETVTSQFP